MNEVVIVVHNGDGLDALIETAMEVAKVKSVSYSVLTFNDCKLFIKKDSTKETVNEEYYRKLKAQV